MKSRFPTLGHPRFEQRLAIGIASLFAFTGLLAAQQPEPSTTDAQRQAMQKLAFLRGNWSGPVSIARGPGEPLHLIQSETVEYKLDGLVMLIEGRSTGASGKAQFAALATVAYDGATHTYRFRAYNDGHYIDTELSVLAGGFSWGFNAGPAKIENTMHLTAQGEWQEITEVTVGTNPPHRSVEMLLEHQP
jgi:hypothetical protein